MVKKNKGRRMGCDWEYTIRCHGSEHWGWTAQMRDKKMSGVETTENGAVDCARQAVLQLTEKRRKEEYQQDKEMDTEVPKSCG